MKFELNNTEEKLLNNWMRQHEEKYHPDPPYPMKIGNGAFYCFQFEPYPIGTIGTVVCKTCCNKHLSKKEYSFVFMES